MISEVQEIDIKKLKKEAKYKFSFQRRLDNVANITSKLYSIRGYVDADEIANNSKLDFTALLRILYGDVINTFDNDLRKKIRREGIDITKEQNESIQDAVDIDSIFYENNRSEIQAQYITDTNKKEISNSVVFATALISQKLLDDRRKRNDLESDLQTINDDLQLGFGNKDKLKVQKREKEKELRVVNNELNEIQENRTKATAVVINQKMKKDNVARSELIAEQEVGNTESFVRQKEAEAVSKSSIVVAGAPIGSKLKKKWDSTLDNRTRPAHADADGQIVGINERFYVGGEYAISPRDPNLSPRNYYGCRCESVFIF